MFAAEISSEVRRGEAEVLKAAPRSRASHWFKNQFV